MVQLRTVIAIVTHTDKLVLTRILKQRNESTNYNRIDMLYRTSNYLFKINNHITKKMEEQTTKESVYYGILNEMSGIISNECRQEMVDYIDEKMGYIKDSVMENVVGVDKLRERYAILKSVKQLLS